MSHKPYKPLRNLKG